MTTDPDGLRYYQRAAVDAICEQLCGGDAWVIPETPTSTLLVLATGLGKTQCFGAVAKHWPGDVLVLAHRNELIEQARARLEQMAGLRVDIEQGALRAAHTARIVVGSVATLHRQGRLDQLGRDRFSLIIVDEAHHATAASYVRVLEYFDKACRLGVTATPNRADGAALGKLFDSVAYTMGIEDGIEAGYLVPLRAKTVQVEELDISDVGKSGKDLAVGQLDEAMLEAVEPVVRGLFEHGEDRTGIVFMPGVKSASYGAERANALQADCARFVSGDTDPDARDTIMREFREKRFRFLFNCMIATEGFDAPSADLVGLARPTLSLPLLAQMIGRGTRVLPGLVEAYDGEENANRRRVEVEWSAKPDCLLLDFVGRSGKYGEALMTPVDALAGNFTEAEIKLAKKKKTGKPLEDLRAARAELKSLAAAVAAKAKTKATSFDPFSVMGIDLGSEQAFDEQYGRTMPSSNQVYYARSLGFTNGDLNGLSKHAVSKLLNNEKAREARELAPFPYLRTFARFGLNQKNMSRRNAQELADYIQSRWAFPSSIDTQTLQIMAKKGK